MDIVLLTVLWHLIPFAIFFWLFRDLNRKAQLTALTVPLIQLFLILLFSAIAWEGIIIVFAFGFLLPYIGLTALNFAGACSVAYCYRRGWKQTAGVLLFCGVLAFMLALSMLMR